MGDFLWLLVCLGIIWAVFSPVSFASMLRTVADEIHIPNKEHRDDG